MGVWNGNDGTVRDDQFQFSSDQYAGDLTIVAQITSFDEANGWSKAGIMFRDSTDSNSTFADILITPDNGIQFQWRTGDGKEPVSAGTGFNVDEPVWVKLVRSGNQFSGFYSTDNVTWIQIGTTQTIAMSETIRGGLVVCAGDNGAFARATFANISVTESRHAGETGLSNVAFQRIDPKIDFNWGDEGSPGTGVGGANWSASWQGKFLADYSGTYTFAAGGDDGVRVWINDQLVVDGWLYQGFTYHYGSVDLVAGQWYSIRMDYFQGGSGEAAQLWWAPPGHDWEVIPASHLSFDNAAPVNQMPGTQVAIENTPLIFSAALGNAIRVADPDACYSPLEVTLALTPGTGVLTLSRTDGLQFSIGDGDGDATMTFIGSLADINAALEGMQYTPGADYLGQVELQITTCDMAPAFAGGSKSDSDVMAVTVAGDKGFLATYFSNPDFSGTAVQAVDPTIDFNWNGASPARGHRRGSNWSAQWLGWLEPTASGSYTFHATSDTGCRVWINDVLVIDHSADAGEFASAPITLTAGQSYLVRMEYAQSGSGGQAKLEWSSNDLLQQVISSEQVNHIDRAPVNYMPDDQSTRLNTPLTFSAANGNAITVGDPDIDPATSFVPVADGGFESPNVGTGWEAFDQSGVIGSAWNFTPLNWSNGYTPNCSGIVGPGSVYEHPDAPAGAQVAFVQGNAAMWQDITFAESGYYSISFQAAYRSYGGQNAFKVQIDGVDVGVFDPNSTSFQGFRTDPLAIAAGTHRLSFQSMAAAGDHTAYIDQVSIAKSESLVQVTLSVDPGTGSLSLGHLNGLVFTDGDGANDETMTFSGSVADVNAALDGLQFLPVTNTTETVELCITTSDLMSPLPGGPKSASNQIALSVSDVSDHSGLLTTYYNWDSTAGPVYRIDPSVDLNWNANGLPAPGIAGNNWNASWEGKVLADYDETYTFHVTADDGVRLWVNGTLLVDAVNNQALNAFTGTIGLEAGQWYSIRLEYYQCNPGGALNLAWSSASQIQETVPESHLSCADLLSQQNAAPTNNLPSQQVAGLNTPLVFSASNGNSISVSDPEIDQASSSVTVGDGSFEDVNIGTGWYSNQYNPTGSAWTFVGDSGLAANESGILCDNGNAPNGTQVAFLQFDGSFYQDINFAEAGNYTISFQAAYRVYGGASPFSVFVDGVNVGTFTPDSAAFHGYQTNSFAVTAGTHRITFSHNASTDQIILIDQVSIARTESLVQVTLALDPGAGTLTLPQTNGLMFVAGDGTNDATMTFSGTLADINAALESIQYMPTANYTGSFNLLMTSTHAGTIFTGGSQSNADAIPIYVVVPSDSEGLLGLFYNGPGGATTDTRNLALGKACSASSQWDDYYAGYLTDNDPSTFAHTQNNPNEWLQVDLGANSELTQIKLINRDGWGDRLQNFTVSVIASDGVTVVWSYTDNNPTYDGEVLTFNTGKIFGQYIRVQKNDANFLHLAEIQAYDLSAPEPDVSRIDPTINFNWGNQGQPAPGVPGSNWSASWQGRILANYSETYTFDLTADDGVRLWIDDQLLIDSWHAQDSTTHTATITLEAGQWYSFRMDYYQISGDAGVALEWSSASQIREVIPSSQFTHLDSAPVNQVPNVQTTDENTPLIFSSANGNAIQIADSDAIYGPLKVTLAVDNGTLTLQNTNNLTFMGGDGIDDSAMTFYGQLADINAALDGLTYTPAVCGDTHISTATLQMTTDDMAPALTGGSQTATSTVSIDIAAPGQYNGLLGTYYSGSNFTGTSYQRVDTGVNFDWGSTNPSPMAGIGPNNWSARWQGAIIADYSETYTFHVSGDDGFRLYVNGQLLVDRMENHSNADSYTGTIDLVAGQAYSFRLDYTQEYSEASIKVEWSSASQAREVIDAHHFQTADQTPAITSPAMQYGIGNQSIIFSESLGNVIAVSELHNDGNPLTITLDASQGALTLSGVNGLTFLVGDGADDSTMTFSGGIADINAALGGLCYTRAAGDMGPATLQITATDPGTSTGSRSSTGAVQIGAVQAQNSGLLATFYADVNLGTPVASEIDETIDFDWGNEGSPAAGVPGANWSVSWEGFIQVPETGDYTFYTTTDDGARLWINNQLVIDAWYAQSPTTHSGLIHLTGGQQYSIRMDYNQYGYGDLAKLEWSNPNMAREVIPAGQFAHAIQPPAVFPPASQSVNEDNTLTFSFVDGNAISIVDVDAESNPLAVTITANNGTFSLGGNQGLSFSTGDGANDAAMTFSGSLADINAALGGLVFTPTAGYSGAAGLRIDATDLVTSMSTSNSVSISVLAINHPPVNTVPNSQDVYDDQTLTFSAGNGNAITVGDPDIAHGASAVAVGDSSFETPNLGAGGGAYQYAVLGTSWTFSGTSGIAANGSNFNNADAPTGDQTAFIQNGGAISQNITFAETGFYTIGFEAAYRPYGAGMNPIMVQVDGVTYGCCVANSTNFQSYRTTSFPITAGTHRVTFLGLNPGGDRTTFIDRVSIDKAENLVQVSLSVDIGKLNLGSALGVVISQGSANGSSAITFTGTVEDVNAALEGLQYVPMDHYEGVDTLRITTNDLGNVGAGGALSSTGTVTINVMTANDPPTINVPGAQGTYVNNSVVFTDANHNGISVSDPDLDPSAMAITVANGSFESPYLDYGSISWSPSGYGWTFTPAGWVGNSFSLSGIAAVGGNQAPSTPAGWQMAFIQGRSSMSQSIIFTATGDYSISFLSAYRNASANSISNPISVLVDGVSVGVITPTSLDLRSYQTNSFHVTAGVHTVTFQGLNPEGGDQTSFVDQVSISRLNVVIPQVEVTLAVAHGSLTLGNTQGLTFTSGDGSGDAAVTFQGTLADVNAALAGLRYDPVNGYFGSDSIQITTKALGTVNAGESQAVTGSVAINVAAGPVVNSTTAGIQQTSPESPQAVAADAQGNYVVVWSSQNQDGDGWGVYARRFNAAGIAQGNEFQVNTHTAGDQMYATVAMNADGSFIVTWSSNNQDGNGWGVYGQRYDAAGNAVGGEFQISATATSDQMYSSVAINDSGDVAVTWSSRNQSNGSWDVYARVFHANGDQTNEFQVNIQSLGDQMYSRIAMRESGNFTVVWQSRLPNGDWDIYARNYDAGGHALDNDYRVNDTTAGDQQNAGIAMDNSGRIVISWTSDSQTGSGKDIYARQYDADGSTEPVYTVSGCGSDIWSNADHFQYASEAVTGDATMIANVDSVTNTGLFAKAGVMFRDSLNPDAAHAMIYVNPENLVVFQWRSGNGGQTTDTEWTQQSAGIVESRVWVKLTRVGNAFSGYYSTDGVTWIQVGQTQTIVMGQSIQAGLAVSSWDANALCTATFKHVSINQSTDLHLVGGDIGPQTYAGSTTVGGEFRVNTTITGDQDYSSVAMDRRGNFFVTWSSYGQDTSGAWGVYGRRYNADGTSTGDEIRINSTTDGSQAYSSVTSLSPKDFLVVWSGNAPGDDAGVFQAAQCPPGLLASYFNSANFSGTPVQRIDSSINFDYGYKGTPIQGFNLDNWSVRWEGFIRADTSETYTFYVDNANSAKLWINGQLVIGSGTSGSISLLAGQWYSIRMDYYQPTGWKDAKLQWSSNSIARELVPSSQLTYENSPPATILPGPQKVNENTTLVFSQANGNALRISDFDAGADSMEVTLAVSYGTLKLGSTNGLTFLAGNGTNNATMTFRGTMDDINAALEGMQFTPMANFFGAVNLQISANDLGNTGMGGAKVATGAVALNVIAPPTIGIPGQQSILEHQTLTFSQAKGTAILIGDPGVGNGTVQVTLTIDKGTISLGGIKGLTFAPGSGPTGATMTFTGTVADVNAALEGMRYVSNYIVADETANLRINVNDLGHSGAVGGAQSSVKNVALTVINVTDPPQINLPDEFGRDPFQIQFSAANGNPIFISDPDVGNNTIMVTIQASDGLFTLSSTEKLRILGGSPSQSAFVIVYGTINNINHALDGLYLKATSSFAEMQIIADDLGSGGGVGGRQQSMQTFYVRRMVDPNFTPGSGNARFQQLSGVLTQPVWTTAQELLHNPQLQAKLPTLDHDQVNAPFMMSNAAQNAMAHLTDAGVNQRGSDRLIDREKGKNSEDTFDVRDAKALEEAKFSADTQNVAEPVELGTSQRRDENILVGLGIVSAGYLAWAFNGGSLLAGAISATPMWKPFDPLAVLDFNDRAAKSGILPLNGETGIVGEDNLQSLLG